MTYYSSIILITCLTLGILAILVLENDRLSKKEKAILFQTYGAVALAALAEWAGIYLNGNTDYPVWALKAAKCLDYIMTPLAGGMLVFRLDSRGVLQTIVEIILVVNTFFQLASVQTSWMVVVDSENHYSHGPLYAVYTGFYLTMIVLIVIEYISYGRNFRRQNRGSLYAVIVMVMVSIFLQELIGGGVRTAYIGMAIGLSLLFIHNQEFVQLAKDDSLKEQRFQILMSQIRPHFLYNTLGAIQELCDSDPQEAGKATAKFSRYLRGNMDTLGNTEPVPFGKELEHTKLYLELEKLRFESSLQIIYDIKCTDFLIPALTLQPIAENAVRHGIRGKRGGVGTVRISTLRTDEGFKILVEDNGAGFDPEKIPEADERSHIGITNVRERLERVCGGSLTIESEPGVGTRATILIPG